MFYLAEILEYIICYKGKKNCQKNLTSIQSLTNNKNTFTKLKKYLNLYKNKINIYFNINKQTKHLL